LLIDSVVTEDDVTSVSTDINSIVIAIGNAEIDTAVLFHLIPDDHEHDQ